MDKKTADPKKYMRDYKRRQYAEQGDQMRARNKAYYYKYKFGLSSDEMQLYGDLTPEVSKVIHLLGEISNRDASLIPHILERFTPVEPNAERVE